MNSEQNLLQMIAEMASQRTQQAGWNGPKWTAEESLNAIAAFDGSSVGVDWRRRLPDEIVSLWDDLPAAAQAAAFLIAADYSLQAGD